MDSIFGRFQRCIDACGENIEGLSPISKQFLKLGIHLFFVVLRLHFEEKLRTLGVSFVLNQAIFRKKLSEISKISLLKWIFLKNLKISGSQRNKFYCLWEFSSFKLAGSAKRKRSSLGRILKYAKQWYMSSKIRP